MLPHTNLLVITSLLIHLHVTLTTADERLVVGITPDWSEHINGLLRSTDLKTRFNIVHLPNTSSLPGLTAIRNVISLVRKSNIQGVIGEHGKVLAMVSEELKIPFITTTIKQHSQGNNEFSMLPSGQMLSLCLLDIIRHYRWEKVAILYDVDTNRIPGEEFLTKEDLDVRVWPFRGTVTSSRLKVYLKQIRQQEIRSIVILAQGHVVKNAVIQARKLAMIAKPYSWLFLNLGSEDIGAKLLEDLDTSITTVNLVTHLECRTNAKNKSLPQSNNLNAAVTLDALAALQEAAKQRTGFDQSITLSGFLKNVSFIGETGIVSFESHGHRKNYTLDIHSMQFTHFEKIGSWSYRRPGFLSSRLRLCPADANDTSGAPSLEGKIARVVIILEKPFAMRRSQPGLTGNDKFEGFGIDLIRELALMMKFKYELYVVHDGNFGAITEKGEWNGIIGEILAGNATMSMAPLSINAERASAVDFTKPFKTRSITVLMKTPRSEASYFQFLNPLSSTVWICVVAAFVAFSFFLFGFESTCQAARRGVSQMNIRESCWFMFGSLVQGSSETTPVTVPGRILTSAWWFFALILISSYTANLAAFLTVKKIHSPITSAADLAEQSRIRYGTVKNSGVMSFFKKTNIAHFAKMWSLMSELEPETLVNSTEEGFRRVKQGNYAFLWDDTVNTYAANEDCDFTTVGPPFDPKGFGIAVAPGATFRDDLSLNILKLSDSGKIAELENKWWGKTHCSEASKPNTDETEELQLENVAGIFFVLVGGAILAFLGCVVELILKHRFKKSLYYRKKSTAGNSWIGLAKMIRQSNGSGIEQDAKYGAQPTQV